MAWARTVGRRSAKNGGRDRVAQKHLLRALSKPTLPRIEASRWFIRPLGFRPVDRPCQTEMHQETARCRALPPTGVRWRLSGAWTNAGICWPPSCRCRNPSAARVNGHAGRAPDKLASALEEAGLIRDVFGGNILLGALENTSRKTAGHVNMMVSARPVVPNRFFFLHTASFMPMSNSPFVLILAGGSGERFWPLSRRAKPKQLLRLLSGSVAAGGHHRPSERALCPLERDFDSYQSGSGRPPCAPCSRSCRRRTSSPNRPSVTRRPPSPSRWAGWPGVTRVRRCLSCRPTTSSATPLPSSGIWPPRPCRSRADRRARDHRDQTDVGLPRLRVH